MSPTRFSTGGVAQRVGDNALHPTLLAFVIALLWTVHPLQTESVTYIIQRAESLMGLFYLLTLYCFIRGTEQEETPFAGPEADRPLKSGSGGELPASLPASGPRDPRAAGSAGSLGIGRHRPSGAGLERTIRLRPGECWYIISVLACLLGMGTKEVMVSAPLIVFLYDRTFVSGSFREAWRAHGKWHVALAATWLPLGILVFSSHSRGQTAGFDVGIPWGIYWVTQFPAVVDYLRLSVWPHPLVFDYAFDRQWVQHPLWAAPAAVAVLGLAAGTVWALRRRPALGFLGVCFFAILAPTSVIPGTRQAMAEHRMYLALAPALVLAVAGLWRLGRSARAFLAVSLAGAVALGWLTARRNEDYRSELVLWRDTVAKRPDNPYAHNSVGAVLARLGRPAEAKDELETALRLDPGYAKAHRNLGDVFEALGRPAEALPEFVEAVRLDPEDPMNHGSLGYLLARLGREAQATAEFRAALRLQPGLPQAHNNYANVLKLLGRIPEARAEYEEALRLDPGYLDARENLARLPP